MRSLTAALALAIAITAAASAADHMFHVDRPAELARAQPVVILGEQHRQPESPALVYELAERLAVTGDCLAVALEISSDQAAVLNAALTGRGPVSEIWIHPIIDHPALRALIEDLGKLARAGRCLTVVAVDAPSGAGVDRDTWIADRIQHLAADRRVPVCAGFARARGRLTTPTPAAQVSRSTALRSHFARVLPFARGVPARLRGAPGDGHPTRCARLRPAVGPLIEAQRTPGRTTRAPLCHH